MGEEDAGSEVGAAVALEIGELRQVGELEFDEVVGFGRGDGRDHRGGHEFDPAAAETGAGGAADHFDQAVAAAEDVGHDRVGGAGDVAEQQGGIAGFLRGGGDGCEFVVAGDGAVDDANAAFGEQALHVGAHLRRLSGGGGSWPCPSGSSPSGRSG